MGREPRASIVREASGGDDAKAAEIAAHEMVGQRMITNDDGTPKMFKGVPTACIGFCLPLLREWGIAKSKEKVYVIDAQQWCCPGICCCCCWCPRSVDVTDLRVIYNSDAEFHSAYTSAPNFDPKLEQIAVNATKGCGVELTSLDDEIPLEPSAPYCKRLAARAKEVTAPKALAQIRESLRFCYAVPPLPS